MTISPPVTGLSIREDLYGLDVLVFSAMKTGTQTLVRSLRENGLVCTHCHRLGTVTTQLTPESFAAYLREYVIRTGRKLPIISVFREPIERLVSTFIYWHGVRAQREGLAESPSDTILSRCSIEQLQSRFLEDLAEEYLTGRLEAVEEFCLAKKIPVSHLAVDPVSLRGSNEFNDCTLHLLPFDSIRRPDELEARLTEITGRRIVPTASNLSADHWSYPVLQAFRESLRMPAAVIDGVYERYADLLRLAYGGQTSALRENVVARYARP